MKLAVAIALMLTPAQFVQIPIACQQGVCVMSESNVATIQSYVRYLEAKVRECPGI